MTSNPRNINPWLIATAVMFATFMEVLDTTVVNVSLPHIAGSLSSTIDEATWALTSYLVANAIILPTTGWLASVFGRKNLLLWATGGFTLASFLCGIAPNLELLILFRILQGATGGVLQPLSQAVLLESFAPQDRGKAMAFWALGIVVAPILGPVVGGWLTDTYSWRWVFYINLPVGVVSFLMTRMYVFDPPYVQATKRGVDYWGLGLLVLGIGALQIVLDKGQQDDWFASPFILTLAIVSVVALIALLVHEFFVDDPVIDLRVFKERSYAVGVFMMTVVGFVLYGSMVLLPIMLQTLLGYPSMQAGIAMAPRGIGSFLMMPVVGILTSKVDTRKLLASGFLIGGLTLIWLGQLNLQAGYWDIFWPQFVQGAGMALMFVPLTTVAMSAISREKMGNATSLFNLMRNIGGSIGIAVTATMLARQRQSFSAVLGEHVSASDPVTQNMLGQAKAAFMAAGADVTTATERAYAVLNGMLMRQATMVSFVTLFRLLGVVFLLMIPLVLIMRRPKGPGGPWERTSVSENECASRIRFRAWPLIKHGFCHSEATMGPKSRDQDGEDRAHRGWPIVLTAPLTETIDHAGYFIQMSMASLPMWLEGILNRKDPQWRNVEYNADGTARYMPAGVRVLEASLLRRHPAEDIVCCYPADLDKFIGPATKVVAVSTHNPLGVTFAAGVYTSIFGSSRQPINSHYARELFASIKGSRYRSGFRVIVGGSGGWQITQTDAWDDLGVDCVVEGRSESDDALDLFDKARRGEVLPRQSDVGHPKSRDAILFPDKRTTFGVVEMTTGCGRRCQFCVPDLNPQIDLPKDRIMSAVRANVRDGNKQISLATEDMFIWGQVHTPTPFYFPNREALLDLYGSIVDTPGVEQHVLSHSTMAPAVVDPVLIRELSAKLLDKSPIHLPLLSTHPKKKALVPLIGLETGSVRMAKQIMPSKGVPFPIEEWPSVVVQGLSILNQHNWFPAMTLIVGNPGETDEDSRATLDLIYEVERRGLFAFFIPSIFTPLHDTRMAEKKGVTETRELTPLQWQIMMKCWKMNLRPGQASWWAPTVWRLGALGLWAWRLRKLNGPGFTWPLFMFANLMPESLMAKMGKLHVGRPLAIKTRKELLATVRPTQWRYLRPDTGDMPDGFAPAEPERQTFITLMPSSA